MTGPTPADGSRPAQDLSADASSDEVAAVDGDVAGVDDGGPPQRPLESLGVRQGEPVRFRKVEGGRWFAGKIATSNPDGSMTLYDANGAARSLFPDRIEIQRPGARGRLAWITLAELATTSEQMMLF